MSTIEKYFQEKAEKDQVTRQDLYENVLPELILPMIILSYFLANQLLDTGFFTDKFDLLATGALYIPLILAFIPPVIIATTSSKQQGRLPSMGVNFLAALGFVYLLLIDVWYEAEELLLIGDFIDNDIFALLMICGVLIPGLMGIWEAISFAMVQKYMPDTQ
ncbi:MAG: hypothetical protein ACXAB4_11230 [Candidatus Hodarchaeales archaeon]|jgi:hypothetical protein